MSKKLLYSMTIILFFLLAIIVNDNYTKKGQTKKIFQGLQKSEMVAHYGKSGEVELLKIDDNNWQLVNYNGYFVTIVNLMSYSEGETTVSVQKIGEKRKY